MQKSVPVRTAVTIGMIVTLTIQPILPCAEAGKREEPKTNNAVPLTCQGCGCCEVSEPEERCCCCSRTEDSEAKPDLVGPVHDYDQESMGICLCGISMPPLDRGDRSDPRVASRLLDHSRLEDISCQPPCTPRLVRADSLPPPFRRMRFSQRFLCTWLI